MVIRGPKLTWLCHLQPAPRFLRSAPTQCQRAKRHEDPQGGFWQTQWYTCLLQTTDENLVTRSLNSKGDSGAWPSFATKKGRKLVNNWQTPPCIMYNWDILILKLIPLDLPPTSPKQNNKERFWWCLPAEVLVTPLLNNPIGYFTWALHRAWSRFRLMSVLTAPHPSYMSPTPISLSFLPSFLITTPHFAIHLTYQ